MNETELRPYVDPTAAPFTASILEMLNAPFCVANGYRPQVIALDRVVLSKHVGPADRNSNGFAHGGCIYSLMDHAFAILTNLDKHAVGQSSYLNFFRPGRGDELEAEARFINVSKSISTVEVRVTGDGKLLAVGTFNAFNLQEIHK